MAVTILTLALGPNAGILYAISRWLGGLRQRPNEGSVDMNIREYNTEHEHINCQFVGGVLTNYQVTLRGR